ncbi:MAG TPA: hypothetical protein ENJ18_14790 [Nannocystis exedens]|nr:hypothetical protein [Nannocystis exedens]
MRLDEIPCYQTGHIGWGAVAAGWAQLLARVFAVDVTVCSKCGRMKILEVVTDPGAIAELLHGAHAPPRPYPLGQLGLFV